MQPSSDEIRNLIDDLTEMGSNIGNMKNKCESPYLRQLLINSNVAYNNMLGQLATLLAALERQNIPTDFEVK